MVTSASLLACEGDVGVTLVSLFVYDGDFVATLGSLGGHFWHLRAALGARWVTLGLLWEHLRHIGVPSGGHFEVILGSVWGQFEYLWMTLDHLMVTLQ